MNDLVMDRLLDDSDDLDSTSPSQKEQEIATTHEQEISNENGEKTATQSDTDNSDVSAENVSTSTDDISSSSTNSDTNRLNNNDTVQNNDNKAQNDTKSETQYVRKYSHRSVKELQQKPKSVEYLIKGFIKRQGLHMLFGESGCGKGFTILDMAIHIACPTLTDWHEEILHHGSVIYFCAEGADGLNARVAAICNEYGLNADDIQLTVIDEVFKLDCTKKEDREHSLETTIAEIKATYDDTALVIFDTVNCFMRGDENNASDAGEFLSACRKIIKECSCSVLVVQHVGLNPDAQKRARGSSAFKAAMDISLQLTNSNDLLTLKVDKNKESKKGKEILFNLREREIPDWLDEDGHPVTSCVIELAKKLMEFRENQEAEKEAQKAERKKPKLSNGQLFALRTYRESAKEYGEIIIDNPDTGHEFIRLDVENWRKTFYQLSSADSENSKRGAFNRARKYLAEETETLSIKRDTGYEYYCLDLSGNTDPSYRLEIQTAIHLRQKAEAETAQTAQEHEAEKTLDLFSKTDIAKE